MRRQRVLVVLDDCGPGDLLAVNFCLTALRRSMPDARLDCLVSARAASVAELTELFDRVMVSRIYQRPSASRALLLTRKLVAAARVAAAVGGRYDRALTLYWGSTLLNLIAWCAAPFRSVGYSNLWPRLVRGGLGPYDPAGDPHEQAVALMAAFGVHAVPATATVPAMDRAVRRPLSRLPELDRPYAVLHTGSDWACQMWLPERWARVADALSLDRGLLPVFTGSAPDEQPGVDRIRSLMREESDSVVGQTSVADLARLMEGAELCVCVDTLPFEVAISVGVPTVVMAGQSRAALAARGAGPAVVVNRTGPEERRAILDCKLTVIKAAYGACHDWECPMAGLRGIQVEDVLGAVDELLRAPGPPVVVGVSP
ncbi:MAG: glycosyltransferase family 9 protein [Chloroflexi bacterium]|nr:MAG: glycosyltransferase family 9 protein [Chloroflexota bacterium]